MLLTKYKYWILIFLFVFLMYQDKFIEQFTAQSLMTEVLNKTNVLEQQLNAGNFSSNSIQFTSKRDGQATHAGKIDWRTWKDSLSIGGAGASGDRKVHIFDKLSVEKDVNAGTNLCVGSTCIDEAVLKRLNIKTKPPTKSGCWLYTEQDCSNAEASQRGVNIKGEWFSDNNGTNATTCEGRATAYNSWCSSTDFKSHYV